MSTTTFSDLLSSLEDFYSKNALSLFVPSLQKDIKFKPLSVDQQKRFLDLFPRSNDFDLADFSDVYDGVLKESCMEEVDVDTLTVVDRSIIALQHRAEIDNDLTLELNDGSSIDVIVSDYVKHAKKAKHTPFKKVLRHDDIKITLEMPTLKLDRIYNNLAKDVVSYSDDMSDDELNKNIKNNTSELALLAAAKHVSRIEVGKKSMTADAAEAYEFFTLIKTLPGNFLKKMVEHLPKLRELQTEPVTLSHKIGRRSKKVSIQINSVLFTSV